MNFCRNIPKCAKRMLQQLALDFSDPESRRVISALASDERMEEIWKAIHGWADEQIEFFAESMFLFTCPDILTDLTLTPERRVLISRSNYELSITAEELAKTIERNLPQAAELWPGPIEIFLQKLREFSQKQSARGLALWSSLEDIPTPNRRGRGNRREIAYGNAITTRLETIGSLSNDKQDMVIAVLTDVVFGHSEGGEVDPGRIKARRKRKRRRPRASSG